jgi:hypothetical protein
MLKAGKVGIYKLADQKKKKKKKMHRYLRNSFVLKVNGLV